MEHRLADSQLAIPNTTLQRRASLPFLSFSLLSIIVMALLHHGGILE